MIPDYDNEHDEECYDDEYDEECYDDEYDEEYPRDCPCPNCGTENVLTIIDVARGYQCNRCADMAERGF